MTDHTDRRLQLGDIVFDDNNQKRQSGKFFGKTCNRSLLVFMSQFFILLLILACYFERITLAENCGETTVYIAIFLVQLDIIYFFQNYEQNIFPEILSFYFIGLTKWIWEISSHLWLVSFSTFHAEVNKIFIKIFLSTLSVSLRINIQKHKKHWVRWETCIKNCPVLIYSTWSSVRDYFQVIIQYTSFL